MSKVITLSYLSDIISSITSIIFSHFILDLRSVYHSNPMETVTKHSTVHFASRVEGNMGATLSTQSYWASSGDETETIQHSEYPFYDGLTRTKEEASEPE